MPIDNMPVEEQQKMVTQKLPQAQRRRLAKHAHAGGAQHKHQQGRQQVQEKQRQEKRLDPTYSMSTPPPRFPVAT